MCKTLPGLRCSTHTYTDLARAKERLEDAINAKKEIEEKLSKQSTPNPEIVVASEKYERLVLQKSLIVDKHQKNYDLAVLSKSDRAIAKHYEVPEPDGPRDPDNPDYDHDAWADYYTKREAHSYLKQRHAEIDMWKNGNPKLSPQENAAFKEKYERYEAEVQPRYDLGLYLEGLRSNRSRLPARNEQVIAMLDHLQTAEENARKLTEDEQAIYNTAVERLNAGLEFTEAAEKKRKNSRFERAKQDAQAGLPVIDIKPIEVAKDKTVKEEEAQRKKAARAEALAKQQRGLTLPPLPPAPVLGQRKDTTPVAPVSGLSSSTGKKLIRVEGADRSGDIRTSPAAPVRPAPTVKPPKVSAPTQVKAPPAPVRPTLLQRLFGRK